MVIWYSSNIECNNWLLTVFVYFLSAIEQCYNFLSISKWYFWYANMIKMNIPWKIIFNVIIIGNVACCICDYFSDKEFDTLKTISEHIMPWKFCIKWNDIYAAFVLLRSYLCMTYSFWGFLVCFFKQRNWSLYVHCYTYVFVDFLWNVFTLVSLGINLDSLKANNHILFSAGLAMTVVIEI